MLLYDFLVLEFLDAVSSGDSFKQTVIGTRLNIMVGSESFLAEKDIKIERK